MSKEEVVLSDELLIEAYLRSQDNLYITELFNRYQDKIRGHCYQFTKDSHDTEDLVQDVFIKVFCNIYRFKKVSLFSTWLFRITRNICIDYVRKKKKMITSQSFKDDLCKRISMDLSSSDSILLEQKCTFANQLLNDMPKHESILLSKKYMEGMTLNDLSKDMDISVSAAKMRLLRIKNRIRRTTTMYYTDNSVACRSFEFDNAI